MIREAAARILAGESLRSVCADLDGRGVPSATGRAWTLQGAAQHAALGPHLGTPGASRPGGGRRRVAGDHLGRRLRPAARPPGQGGGARPSGPDPPPLPAQRRPPQLRPMRQPHGMPGPSPAASAATCALPGPGFAGCGRMATLAEPVEALVAEAVLQRLDTPELAAALADARHADAEADHLHTELAADEAMLDDAGPGLRRPHPQPSGVDGRPSAHPGPHRLGPPPPVPHLPHPPPRRVRRPLRPAPGRLGRLSPSPVSTPSSG